MFFKLDGRIVTAPREYRAQTVGVPAAAAACNCENCVQ